MYSTRAETACARRPARSRSDTPVSDPLQENGDMIQVRVLDALWHWTSPATCAAAHQGPVWIKAAVVSRDYPAR